MPLKQTVKNIIKSWPIIGGPAYWVYSLLTLGAQRRRLFYAIERIESELPEKTNAVQLERFERRISDLIQSQRMVTDRHWHVQHAALLREIMVCLRPESAVLPPPPVAESGGVGMDDFYWALGDAFRGSAESVRERLQGYLEPVVETVRRRKGTLALDLGCGRGEWLELLRDAGVEGVGVDGNNLCVEYGRQIGLNIENGGILEFLRQQPNDRFSAITGFHIVEHLAPEELLQVLRESWRVLGSGGLLVLETPNPENFQVASRMFYRDPSHRSPLPPELLEFMVGWCGFSDAQVLRLNPYPMHFRLNESDPAAARLNEILFGPQDYAILARTE